MNKKELQQRGKGLLALMLAFIMMFGTSMTVLAATTYTLDSASSLSTGQILQGGDTLFAQTGSGALEVVINNQNVFREHGNKLVPTVSYTLPTGSDYKVMIYVGGLASSSTYYAVELESISNTPSGGNTGGGSTGGGNAGGNTAVLPATRKTSIPYPIRWWHACQREQMLLWRLPLSTRKHRTA